MKKLKLAVVYGGMSTENEVSCISATSVIKNLNKKKYEIYPIFISKEGIWFEANDISKLEEKVEIENIMKYLKNMDVIFPVLHGLYGEDGTIQGVFELLKKPYVGCKVLASSIGMDKAYSKIVFEKAGLNQAEYVSIKKYGNEYVYINEQLDEEKVDLELMVDKIIGKLNFPMFIKPSNSGSSVGINKAHNKNELKKYMEEASKYDNKILIEEGIVGKEVECAVLGNEEVIASCVGEIKSADEFYSYDAKYNNEDSKTLIPADISRDKTEEIRKLAIKAFKAIDGKGLSRVDFFIEEKTEKVYINEINTLPGFTSISMYPKLFDNAGISYSDLLDRLIKLALNYNKNP